MTTDTNRQTTARKPAAKRRSPRETSASFQKKVSAGTKSARLKTKRAASGKAASGKLSPKSGNSRAASAKTTSARPRKAASLKKPAPRKRLSVDERKRQLRFRVLLAIAASAFLILAFLRHQRALPFQNGRAVNLTDSVIQYQDQVEYYCKEYDIPAYSQVILAIMQQESAGAVPDVMQASESPFNTWYSNAPGSITDPDYSIKVGVETFAYCLDEAQCTSPGDEDGLKLALQTYNYGNSYAAWALDHYGGYSADNALEFSENMKARLGWSQYGDPEYVDHVLRYYRPGY